MLFQLKVHTSVIIYNRKKKTIEGVTVLLKPSKKVAIYFADFVICDE